MVLSQDRKLILKGKSFMVERNLGGGKEKKFVIIGLAKDGMSSRILAYYTEEKTAVDELRKLFEAMQAGEKTYIMPE